MRILFYNHTGVCSGAERILLTLCTNLRDGVFEPVLACPNGDLAERARNEHIPVHIMEELVSRFTWRPDRIAAYFIAIVRHSLLLRRLVRKCEPDLIHANSIRAGLVASAGTLGMPVRVVWHVHDMMKRHPLSTAIRLFAIVLRVDEVVGVSNAVAASFRGKLGKLFPWRVPVRAIYNGIDCDKFRPDSADRSRKRASLGLTDDQVAIGIIGQIAPRKGHLELIEAFRAVSAAQPSARLLIAGLPLFRGNDAYLRQVRLAVEESGLQKTVDFLGHCEDTPSLIRALDLVVVNSRTEPFGLVVVEAQASGTPVVATSVDGIPELIDNGVTGYLLATLEPADLAKRLTEVLANPGARQTVGLTALKWAASRFSMQRMVSEFEQLYQSGKSVLAGPNATVRI